MISKPASKLTLKKETVARFSLKSGLKAGLQDLAKSAKCNSRAEQGCIMEPPSDPNGTVIVPSPGNDPIYRG